MADAPSQPKGQRASAQELIDMDDNKIYMTKEELAENTHRSASDITDEEYEKYVAWMKSDW